MNKQINVEVINKDEPSEKSDVICDLGSRNKLIYLRWQYFILF